MTPERGFADLTNAKVLVVENGRDYLELLMTLLAHCDAHVTSARTVAEARNAAMVTRPDVILCDRQPRAALRARSAALRRGDPVVGDADRYE